MKIICAALLAAVLSLLVATAARADVVPVASGSGTGTGSVSISLAVPSGSDRVLAVGVATTDSATVTAVTYGAQALTRQQAVAQDGVSSEIWTLVAPAVGTANVTVTLSAAAPVIAGATSHTGVDQAQPILNGTTGAQRSPANSASLVMSNTTVDDGMFGTIAVGNSANTTAIGNGASNDLVVADTRWSTVQGGIRGAGATRTGNTGQNMALFAGINWRWSFGDPTQDNPYAQSLIALRVAPDQTAPTVATPTVADVDTDSALLGGAMTSTGGATIQQRGVVLCTCANPQLGGAGVTRVDAGASDVPGAFTVTASGLSPSTEYTMRAFASNSVGTGYSAPATFTTSAPPNQPPSASAGGPYTIFEGASLALDASGSDDPEGDALTYTWDVDGDSTFGDATGVAPTLTWSQLQALGLSDGPATADVRVRVADASDATTSAAVTLTIVNVAPTSTLTDDGPVSEGGVAQVGFTGSADPSSVDIAAGLRYAFDLDDDGTWDLGGATYAAAVTAASATVPAALLADGPGTRTVRAAIVDRDGGVREYTTAIAVENAAPTATLADVTVDEGEQATVAFRDQSDPSAADTSAGFSYEFDLDDDGTFETAGAAPTATLPAASTADDGTLTVHGAIVDRDGGRTAYETTVTVENAPPTVTLTGPADVPASGVVSVTLDAGDPGEDQLTTTLDWGDGTTETVTGGGERSVSHTYHAPGPYVVTAVARDDDGGESAPASHALTVAPNPDPPVIDPPVIDLPKTSELPVTTQPPPPPPTAAPPGAIQPPRPATAPALRIRKLVVASRCVRASGPRGLTARTLAARFRLTEAARVRLTLHRRSYIDGLMTCPTRVQRTPRAGRALVGYQEVARRDVAGRAGVNRVAFAGTGRRGLRLRPGTYLLTVSSGGARASTQFWVLAPRPQVPRRPAPCASAAGPTATASC